MSVSYIHHVGSYNPASGRHVLSLSVALPRTGVSSELHARPAVTQSVFWPRLVAHTCGARQPHLSAAPRPARPRHRASPPALSQPTMRGPLDYLHDPELVARFQRRCGLFLVGDARRGPGRTRAPAGTPAGPRGQPQGTRGHQGDDSDLNCRENGRAVSVSRFLSAFKSAQL